MTPGAPDTVANAAVSSSSEPALGASKKRGNMTPEETIAIELTLAERHTFHDLLANYIKERVDDGIKFARYSIDPEKAAARSTRLARLKGLAEGNGSLPRAELDALRAELAEWVAETEAIVDEHDELIVKADQDEELSPEQRLESIDQLRRMSAVDYAHACVCERIVAQVGAAREAVTG